VRRTTCGEHALTVVSDRSGAWRLLHLTLQAGQVVTVSDTGDGWVFATVSSGEEGWAPADFLEAISDSPVGSNGDGASAGGGDAPSSFLPTHTVDEDFDGAEADQLRVAKGDAVLVADETDTGTGWTWAETAVGVSGWVPTDFLIKN
jgi:hypothetical protein